MQKIKYTRYTLSNEIEYCTIDEVLDFMKKTDILFIDTETNHSKFLLGDIILFQVGNQDVQYLVDCRDYDIRIFKDLLENKRIVGHNLSFEYKWLKKYGILLPLYLNEDAGCYDTMLAEMVLTTGLEAPIGYGALVKKYHGLNIDKGLQQSFLGHTGDFSISQLEYSAKDVEFLPVIKQKQEIELSMNNMDMCIKLENLYMCVVGEMEFNGIPWDKEKMLKKTAELEIEKDNLEKQLDISLIELNNKFKKDCSVISLKGKKILTPFQYDLFNVDKTPDRYTNIYWSSSLQKQTIIDILGLTCYDKHGKKSTDIKVLAQKKNNPFIKLIIDHAKISKLISTYGRNFIKNYYNEDTKRIYSSYFQIKNTGRSSSGSQDKKNKGTVYWNPTVNTQNIPPEYRKFAIAPDGWEYITADYSGQETVVLAELSREPNLLAFYKSDESDLHSYIARMIYPYLKDKTMQEVKDNYKKERQNSKFTTFTLAYGGNELTVAVNAEISVEEAKNVVDSYFKAFPDLKNYFAKCHKEALSLGYILIDSITGRRSYLPEWKEWKAYKAQYNLDSKTWKRMMQIQGSMERASVNYRIQGEIVP